jgi:hypothetical protein
MIYLLLFLSTISAWCNSTKFDLSGGIQGRTLPSFGAELYAESGYNFITWGKKETSKDFLYGLIRPSFGVSTSGVINSIKGELEIFPISIWGISLGRQIIHSNFDFPFLDCEAAACKGEYQRNFVENKMVIGHKGWVALGNFKIDNLHSPDSSLQTADWRNVILGNKGNEVQIEKKLLVAKLFSNKMLGVLLENVEFQGSHERKESYVAVYQFKRNSNFYMFGSGIFHTDQQPMGFQIYFRIHHVALPSLKLF